LRQLPRRSNWIRQTRKFPLQVVFIISLNHKLFGMTVPFDSKSRISGIKELDITARETPIPFKSQSLIDKVL
jgi:hypothetical protein